MTEDELTEEVKQMFFRMCDVGVTTLEGLTMIALLLGKNLATYAPDRASATDWLREHDKLVMQTYERLTESYQRERHPLDRGKPH